MARYQMDAVDQLDQTQSIHRPVYVKDSTLRADDLPRRRSRGFVNAKQLLSHRELAARHRLHALDEVASLVVAIPSRLPTPIPSDDDPDPYREVDSVRSDPPRVEDSGELEDGDKVTMDASEENTGPPHLVSDVSGLQI
ncbi:hypothetical protein GSI_04982 [Ganoderma sinense ZZ0214-1]|uniref:Uncharacterized protein n=1 Tax=Ganoderma sinense ZZ0214-1 TaxID=1077348 RepID=A0A2G8SGG4_9APHY|nr:hypothetical protein GSI_04982 [Ganoderma sinense ZZ0214-1]